MTTPETTAAPAWHKRPTCPGLWVCEPEDFKRHGWVVLSLDDERIAAGAPFYSRRVYGPIPSPPKETETNG